MIKEASFDELYNWLYANNGKELNVIITATGGLTCDVYLEEYTISKYDDRLTHGLIAKSDNGNIVVPDNAQIDYISKEDRAYYTVKSSDTHFIMYVC